MERIVLFDGVCNFCNGAVNFIIRHDSDKKFKFAALQSDAGQEIVRNRIKKLINVDSIILFEDNQVYFYSTAILKIAKSLGGIWSLAYIFILVPEPIRNWFYKLFAKFRYRLFGKKDLCMVPTPEVRERFLA